MTRLVAISVSLLSSGSAMGCMGVGWRGAPVRFSGQTNIVIWDKAHQTEHFVRDARFETNGKSLGFIAPTPGRPEIEAVDGEAFELLRRLDPAASRQILTLGAGGRGGRGVTVIEKKIVAGYEATVLRADDVVQLVSWLRSNGYSVPRYTDAWVSPYVQRKWYFTAFKVAAHKGAGATGPVRMSFKTSLPFNPYSVPTENRGRGGLELYYISPTADKAKIGGTKPWLDSRWSDFIGDPLAEKLEASLKLPKGSIPKGSFVNCYRDTNFGRNDDVYFVEKPRKIVPTKFGGLAGVTALGLCALVCPMWRRAKRR
ncbi:DUF2330 domain-containing protein [bacterium]|nr:MAG: DUF2330 domain-containing protein [bacterium]